MVEILNAEEIEVDTGSLAVLGPPRLAGVEENVSGDQGAHGEGVQQAEAVVGERFRLARANMVTMAVDTPIAVNARDAKVLRKLAREVEDDAIEGVPEGVLDGS